MGLSGSQRQQLQEALIDAFPDKASLDLLQKSFYGMIKGLLSE